MWVLLSALVSGACALASARRLAWAVQLLAVDAHEISAWLEGTKDAARRPAREGLVAALSELPAGAPERALWDALECADPAERDARLNEELLELQWRAERWARVPRVCASISSSGGFLFATLTLLGALSAEAPVASADLGGALAPALDAFGFGLAGAAFSLAAHLRSRQIARDRLAAVDRLVDRMRA